MPRAGRGGVPGAGFDCKAVERVRGTAPRGEARTAVTPQLAPAQTAAGGLGPPAAGLAWPDSERQWRHPATRPDQIPFEPDARPLDGLEIGLPFFVMVVPPGIKNQHHLSGGVGAAAL